MDEYIPNSDNDVDATFIGESLLETNAPRRTRNRRITRIPIISNEDMWSEGWNPLSVSQFSHHVGLNVPRPSTAIGFFKLYITDYIIKFMVVESNKYAKRILGEIDFGSFDLITIDEMNKFICIVMYMGIGNLPFYEMYWKKAGNPWHNDFCGKLLSFDRFTTIKKFFHVFDNEVFDSLENDQKRFSKLDCLIGYFNNKFKEIYDPERDLAVDENMCSWSGNGGSKVYMPLKPVKYGMKIYAMCESKTGYACSMIHYNSKNKEGVLEIFI